MASKLTPRSPIALLLIGPGGCGKSTLARAFASARNALGEPWCVVDKDTTGADYAPVILRSQGLDPDDRDGAAYMDLLRTLASRLAAFAAQHGARVFVVEDLKGWRPKGPSKAMRQRFHRFEHRALVHALTLKAQETGARLLEVFARGTSRWAYDGSGKVVRSKVNAQLATFASGKQYNADLNGALNIAARGLAILLGVQPRETHQAASGKSSGAVARMPLVLADIWAHARSLREPSHHPGQPGGHPNDAPTTAPCGA